MMIRLLKSKIHCATVTETNLDYTGSIAIDQALMEKVSLVPYEQVLVANINNGTRHETYVVPAPPDKGDICVMGAAAHLVNEGDNLIIMAFANYPETNITNHKPKVIVLDGNNRIVRR